MLKNVLAFMALTISFSANAAFTFLDNGSAGTSAIQSSYRLAADDFSYSRSNPQERMRVTGATIETFGSIWDGTIEYFIFSDNGGKPGDVLNTGLADSFTTSGSGGWSDPRILSFDFVDSFLTEQNSIYWFGVHLKKDYVYGGYDYYNWFYSNNDGNSWVSQYGTLDNWTQSYAGEMAFSLQGEIATVPLPPAVWFLGSALLGLVGLKRKNQCKTQK